MRHKKYLRILIASYLGVLLVPLSIGMLSYFFSGRAIEEEIFRTNLAVANQTLYDLDRQMQQKDHLFSNLSLNNQVNGFLSCRKPLTEYEHYMIYNISSLMSVMKNGFPDLESFYIYFTNSDTLIAPGAVYSPRVYYENEEKLHNVAYEDWYDMFLREIYRSPSDLFCPNAACDDAYLVYKRSLPISLLSNANANIIAYVKKDTLRKVMPSLDQKHQSACYLIDEKHVLLESGAPSDINIWDYADQMLGQNGFLMVEGNKGRTALTYVSSTLQNWTLVYETPIDAYMASAEKLKKNLFAVVYATLAVGLVLVFYFVKKAYSPVKRIVAQLPENGENRREADEFHFLQTTLFNALEQDKRTAMLLKQQRPLVSQHLLSRLVNGALDFCPSTQELLDEVGIDLSKDGYIVCALRVSPDYEAADQFVLIPVVEECVPEFEEKVRGRIYVTGDNRGVIALIINMPRSLIENGTVCMEDLMREMNNRLFEKLNLPLFAGIGRVAGKATSIVRSFTQAMQALDHALLASRPSVLSYDSIVHLDQHYYYPFEVEQQLASFLRAASENKAQRLIDYLFLENLEKRSLAPEMLNMFYMGLIGTMSRVTNDMKLAMEEIAGQQRLLLSEINRAGLPPHVTRERLRQIVSNMCAQIEQMQKSHNKPMALAIENYVLDNCCDPALSLQTVSDAVNLSPAYLSRFFKEQTGENFSSYLSRIRVQVVKRLLMDRSLSLNEIPERAGFTNMTTFVRVFKKATGQTPAAWRQNAEVESPSCTPKKTENEG